MTLRALIIDDEPLAHRVVLEYAKLTPFLEIAGQCYQAAEALPLLNRQQIDLIFLDIHLPRISGLDLLRTLHKKPLIIVTSAYQDYALESFELDVCDYLLKPFSFERFLKAVNKALELRSLKQPAVWHPDQQQEAPEDHLFLKTDSRSVRVELADIYFLESYGNYVKVWLATDFHLALHTLSGFESRLAAAGFIQIHKSYLINKKHIAYVEGNLVVLKNGKKLPVGKTFRQGVRDLLQH